VDHRDRLGRHGEQALPRQGRQGPGPRDHERHRADEEAPQVTAAARLHLLPVAGHPVAPGGPGPRTWGFHAGLLKQDGSFKRAHKAFKKAVAKL
jgi:hypothetical protein